MQAAALSMLLCGCTYPSSGPADNVNSRPVALELSDTHAVNTLPNQGDQFRPVLLDTLGIPMSMPPG